MTVTHVVGVDPGLVHTGVVMFAFDEDSHELTTSHEAVAGPDAAAVKRFVPELVRPHGFIEAYRPRSHFSQDQRMAEAVHDLKQLLPWAKVLDNTGVKKVVPRELLTLLGAWQFSTPTHHQDLRSAARIAVLGMMKDPVLNVLLADFVRAHLDGRSWHVRRDQ